MTELNFAQANRFLVIRLGAIGDVLRVLPAVRRLRVGRPDATIAWAVEEWAAPVLEGNTNFNRLHILKRKELRAGGLRAVAEIRRFRAEIRAEHYEVVLDCHGRLRSGLVAWMSGAPLRLGYARGQESEGNFLFTNRKVRLEDPSVNRVQRFLRLLEPLGLDTAFDPSDTGVQVPAALATEAGAWYESAGKPPLAVYPGGSLRRARRYRWPVDRWIELLRELSGRGVRSVVFWGPDEEAETRAICGAVAGCQLAPRTRIPEMMAMIGCFRAYLGTNTAALHMAWLQGVPSAFFTGPVADARKDMPLPPVRSRALQAEVVGEVGVNDARDAVLDLLGG
ncbi:MAG: glycosyltransferase family 9 protein [bacterium]